jgi:hypothetical protein
MNAVRTPKIQFYHVDPGYIAYLKAVDARVPDVVYPGRHSKMLCGVVLELNGISYYAPLSSKIHRADANFLIKNRKEKPIASLRIQYMIPVPENILARIDISLLRQEDKTGYGDLVLEEYQYCNRPDNIAEIYKKAQKAYRIAKNPNHYRNQDYCDFAALEAAMLEYHRR